jgi:hypothetical protein
MKRQLTKLRKSLVDVAKREPSSKLEKKTYKEDKFKNILSSFKKSVKVYFKDVDEATAELKQQAVRDM